MPTKRALSLSGGTVKSLCASVFPNTYYIGMSNLALHILYTTLNSHSDIVCERCFFNKEQLRSFESGKPLTSFDLVFITLSFELDFV